MTADLKSSRSDNDLERRALYLRGSGGSRVEHMAPVDHLSDVPGPQWTDLFYIAVAFGAASGIFWLAGY
ncbi:hypothetical protein N7E70_021055 [Aminobacter sp. NyZ550]|jgi:hypothetical protein|uniref:Uncharacterized protein n=1 Tax=Aminobacter ciceronei TaxID=150723 RepID=A0ABR6C2K4_9HYPH|nr:MULTISPECIES: hypothetical protein [Aminobacter]MBA8905491.1 hypothetical protein [Aminobacter ciceronei]MBA9019209.1 hypothetical protein [Aminobacter ciceronei]WAX94142.1 hypothetical protein N7E70_021055 [Aminobacter sp. NyZ550]BBD37292.1 hypothetical protein Amn_21720 [Aminobacter sp. SS-2016]